MRSARGHKSGANAANDNGESIVQADKRLQWIEARILAAFRPVKGGSFPVASIRKVFEDDETRRDMTGFFDTHATRCLYIFCPNGSQNTIMIRVAQVPAMLSAPKILCFRKVGHEKISADNIGRELSIMELSPNAVEQLHFLARDVYSPLCAATPNVSGPVRRSIQQVLGQMSDSAYVLDGVQQGVTRLSVPPAAGERPSRSRRGSVDPRMPRPPPSFSGEAPSGNLRSRTGSVILNKGALAGVHIHKLESIASNWITQLRGVIAKCSGNGDETSAVSSETASPTIPAPHSGESTTVADEPVKALNPLEECRRWRLRQADLEGLSQQIASPTFESMLAALDEYQSHYAHQLKQLATQVDDLLRDVKTINRWLSPLEQHFESIDPNHRNRVDYTELANMNVFPLLMHLLQLLWTHNDVYGTSARIGGLIIGLTDNLVEASKYHLGLETYFLNDPHETNLRLATVFEVCESFKASFFVFKHKAATSSKGWKISHPIIFRHLDIFLERCNDLVDVLEARKLLAWVNTVDVGGVDGQQLKQAIDEVTEGFDKELHTFVTNALDYITLINDPTFPNASAHIRKIMQNVEARIADAVVQHIETTAINVEFVKRIMTLQRLLDRPCVSLAQQKCHNLMWLRWAKDVRNIQQIHQANVNAREAAEATAKGRSPSTPGVHRLSVTVPHDSATNAPMLPGGGGGDKLTDRHPHHHTPLSKFEMYVPPTTQHLLSDISLYRRLHDLHDEISKLAALPTVDKEDEDLDEALLLFNATSAKISDAVEHQFSSWLKLLTSTVKELTLPLFAKKEVPIAITGEGEVLTPAQQRRPSADRYQLVIEQRNVYIAQLSSEVMNAVRDVRMVKGILGHPRVAAAFPHLSLSPEAKQLFDNSDTLWKRFTAIRASADLFSDTNRMLQPHEAGLLAPEIALAEKCFARGVDELCWNADSVIDLFSAECEKTVNQFMSSLAIIRENVTGLGDVLNGLSPQQESGGKTFIPLLTCRVGDKTLSLEELAIKYDAVSSHWGVVAKEARQYFDEVSEKALAALNDAKDAAGVPRIAENSDEWQIFMQQLDTVAIKNLREFVKSFFSDLRHQLDGNWLQRNDGLPLLDVQVAMLPPPPRDANGKIIPQTVRSDGDDDNDDDDDILPFSGLKITPNLGSEVRPMLDRLRCDALSLVKSIRPELSAAVITDDGSVRRQSIVDVLENDPTIAQLIIENEYLINTTWPSLTRLFSTIANFESLWQPDIIDQLKEQVQTGDAPLYKMPLSDILDNYRHYNALVDKITHDIPSTATIQWLRLDFKGLKQSLRQNSKQCADVFAEHVREVSFGVVQETTKFMHRVNASLERDLIGREDSDAVRELFELLRSVRLRNKHMEAAFAPVTHGIRLLLQINAVSREELDSVSERMETLQPDWEKLYKRCLTIHEQMASVHDREVAKLKDEIEAFKERAHLQKNEFRASRVFQGGDGDVASPTSYEDEHGAASSVYDDLDRWYCLWRELEAEGKVINEAQDLYDLRQTEFTDVVESMRDLKLVKGVWDASCMIQKQVAEWMATPFLSVDSSALVDETRNFALYLQRMSSGCKSWKCYTATEATAKNLMTSLPLVQELRSPALRPRHWQELMELCMGISASPPSEGSATASLSASSPAVPATPAYFDAESSDFTLRYLLQLNLHKYTEEVMRLVEKADKELQIEKTLNKIEDYWKDIGLVSHFNSDLDLHVLAPIDDIVETLEEHVNTLQSMQTSRWVEYFRAVAVKWQEQLSTVEVTLTLWSEVQKLWSSLFPIYARSEDMRLQLPDDAVAFDGADGRYRELMKRSVAVDENIVTISHSKTLLPLRGSNQEGRIPHEELEDLEDILVRCEKRLAEYLESKRRIFPRFYFLSNTDLVDILSKANHPPSVCGYISKIISAVEQCIFSEENPTHEIVSFTSIEGEQLVLTEPFLCEGKVEQWLNGLLVAMQTSVRTAISNAVTAYAEIPRVEWMFQHIAQAICVASRIHWTSETTTALEAAEDGNLSAMGDHVNHLKQQLNGTIETVLQDLPAGMRKALITLITIDVHARDIVMDLAVKRIDSPLSFIWQSQLRFYSLPTNKNCQAQICDSEFENGNEYIGNCGCLVITPLTDRCYITLTQALKLHKGGAPAGPAGTGKTETVKDISHAFGYPVYVFNCSDQMDFLSVGNIFKGLAMSGAYGCFDEFNRIAIEVLSVVASQVKSILDALRRKSETFQLLGETHPVKPSVGIFITMNPGYKGRTELPENIKALFRPCAMVVPDVAHICEIMLSAEGFTSAKELAKKFVRLYQLNSELLSPQDHYDWGLRAIRAVLLVAGSLKRKYPQQDERTTLMKALRDANLAKLSANDVSMFLRLIAALFVGVQGEPLREPELGKCIETAAIEKGYTLGEGSIVSTKCIQLYDLLQVRHSVFVIGPSGAGKSVVLKLLARAMELHKGVRTLTETFDPKAITSDELYGCINDQTREWKDGVLSKIFREFSTGPRYKKSNQWIVLDGDIDAEWIESMNSVMDDNKLLTLANGERVTMTPQMRLVFEITHLQHATPATVSRAGILFINDTDISWGPMKDRWVASRKIDQQRSHLDILFDKHIITFIQYTSANQRSMIPMSSIAYVQNVCRLLEAILDTEEFSGISSDLYERVFLWSCIWAFGSTTQYAQGVVDYRHMFSMFVRREFNVLRLPDGGSVFDYRMKVSSDKTEIEWVSWEADSALALQRGGFSYDTSLSMSRMVVPTPDLFAANYIASVLVNHATPVLFCGAAGTGKSTAMRHCIQSIIQASTLALENAASGAHQQPADLSASAGKINLDASTTFVPKPQKSASVLAGSGVGYATLELHFSALTDSVQLQTKLERSLEKRVGRQFGPIGRKRLIVCLENVNMPLEDKYGSQSAIALLRQHIDHGFWYDRQKLTAKDIVDLQYVAVMNPDAGVKFINDRLAQKFFTIGVGFPAQYQLQSLFTTLLESAWGHVNVRQDLLQVAPTCVSGLLELWGTFTKRFLPTANAFHYSFTLRDVARVVQGLANVTHRTPINVIPPMWFHEVRRVFEDRLANLDDAKEGYELVLTRARMIFTNTPGCDMLVNTPESVIFSPFTNTCDTTTEGTLNATFSYQLATDMEDLAAMVEEKLQEFGSSTNLVLFDQALEHLVRLSRILTLPGGNALLVGVGGSGKRSMAALAAQLAMCELHRVRISANFTLNDFRNDMVRLVTKAAIKGTKICFVLVESDVVDERMLPYVNDLLSANTMDIFTADEAEDLQGKLSNELRAAGHANYTEPEVCWEHFRKKLASNLRTVVCVSPLKKTMKPLLRNYPGLTAGTQLICFHEWPTQALEKVARRMIENAGIEFEDYDDDEEEESAAAAVNKNNSVDADEEGIDLHAVSSSNNTSFSRKDLSSTPQPGTRPQSARVTPMPESLRANNFQTPEHSQRPMSAAAAGGATPQTLSQQQQSLHLASAVAVPMFENTVVNLYEPTKIEKVCTHLAFVHNTVREQCAKLQKDQKLTVHVTPRTYLAFVEMYVSLTKQQRQHLQDRYDRLENGVQKLLDCSAEVANLQVTLKEFKGVALEKARVTELLLEKVGNEREVVEQQNLLAKAEEAKTNKIVLEVDALVKECEADLKAAQPIVEAALAALNTLNKSNLTELKSMSSPPEDVRSVTACVLVLTCVNPNRIPRDQSWAASKRMMADVTKWMKELLAYDVNNIPQQCVDAIMKIVRQPGFNPESIKTKSFAAASLCAWVVNVVKYHEVRVVVRPKEERLAESQGRLEVSKKQLRKVQDRVAELQRKLDALVDQYNAAVAEKEDIEAQLLNTELKLKRAHRLVASLGGERSRWSEGSKKVLAERALVDGNTIAMASFITYSGPFPQLYRAALNDEWLEHLQKLEIRHVPKPNPIGILRGESDVAKWHNEGLPSGELTSHNAVIFECTLRWPLLIDPQSQALQWLRQRYHGSIAILRQTEKKFVSKLLELMQQPTLVVIESVTADVDPLIHPILGKKYKVLPNGTKLLAVGDHEVTVHPKFMLCLHCNVANPTFRPELFAETTVINFTVTETGLTDQLLSMVVALEKPDLEKSRVELVHQMNQMSISLNQCENTLLEELTNASGDILENERLVTTLEETKQQSLEITIALEDAAATKAELFSALSLYNPIAARGTLIYLKMMELPKVDSMYHHSIKLFVAEFKRAIEQAQRENLPGNRIENFVAKVTEVVFGFVDRSLFTAHKFLFAAMVAFTVLLHNGTIALNHVTFLLHGPRKFAADVPEHAAEWLTITQWGSILALADVEGTTPSFRALPEEFLESNRWRTWCELERPELERMPGDWKLLTPFQRLLIIRCLRPDRTVAACQNYIADTMGRFFFEDFAKPLGKLLETIPNEHPLLFVLSPGADPGRTVEDFAATQGITEANSKLVHISMGQGQEKWAESALQRAAEKGNWVMLHNVHLMRKWVSHLEQVVQKLLVAEDEGISIHPDYRLFITAEPVDHLPSGLLQSCVKLVNEPPSGLKANFVRAYHLFESEPWELSTKPHEYHVLVYCLCFFHAVAIERSKFGPAGWNRKYPFNFEDLLSCTDVLAGYLEDRPRVPWEDLRYVFGEIMYGGHITDVWDRRLCLTYLAQYISAESVDNPEIAPGVPLPSSRSFTDTIVTINETFPQETPQLFQMNPISENRARSTEARKMFSYLLDVMPQCREDATGEEDQQLDDVALLMGAVPDTIHLDDIEDRLLDDRTPFQHVFYQECERMNMLSSLMRKELDEAEAALKGRVTMSRAVEDLLQDITLDAVPHSWLKIWGASNRPLGSWTALLAEAAQQLTTWSMDLTNPKVVQLQCLFIPIAFLTSILQDTALRVNGELDHMGLVVEVTKKSHLTVDMHAREGCYIYGPALEGAGWDTAVNCIQEARVKDAQPLPVMNIRAVPETKLDRSDSYQCPMYRTSSRYQTYITTLHLKTRAPASHWVLRGAALILDPTQ